jgi:hypothetical protein
MAKKLAFFAETTASFWQKFDHNIGFWEKRPIFAEISDHNINPAVKIKDDSYKGC